MAEGSEFCRPRLIRFSDCDPAGIVFYPQFFVLFHELIEDWFNDGLGLDYAAFVSRERRGLPTVHIECDFKIPSQIGDEVELRLAVVRIGDSSITLDVSLHVGAQERVRARQVVVLFALDEKRALAIPADLRARIERFLVVA